MHYLTCFEPTESLTDILAKEQNLVIPSSGLHCTILSFHLREKSETRILDALSELETEPFIVKVTGYSYFDFNSHVLLLTKPQALQQLHEKVVKAVRPFYENPHLFDEMLRKYVMEQYHPHITISKCIDKPQLQEKYVGTSMMISKYQLLKNKNSVWKKVADFDLL